MCYGDESPQRVSDLKFVCWWFSYNKKLKQKNMLIFLLETEGLRCPNNMKQLLSFKINAYSMVFSSPKRDLSAVRCIYLIVAAYIIYILVAVGSSR